MSSFDNDDNSKYWMIGLGLGIPATTFTSSLFSGILIPAAQYESLNGKEGIASLLVGVLAFTSSYTGIPTSGTVGLAALSGQTSPGPDGYIGIDGKWIPFYTNNDLPSDVVERRAKALYDVFDKNHIPTVDGGATLVTDSSEAREILNQIFEGKTPQEITEGLAVMEKVLRKK